MANGQPGSFCRFRVCNDSGRWWPSPLRQQDFRTEDGPVWKWDRLLGAPTSAVWVLFGQVGAAGLKRLLGINPDGCQTGSIMSRRRVTWQTRPLIFSGQATLLRYNKSVAVLQSINMVDFNKQLSGGGAGTKPIVPTEIYEKADRESDTGPLRPAQIAVLNEWHSKRRAERDVIIKMHTGQGKTLIGLLILQSKMNETEEPAVYICPNIYLVNRAVAREKIRHPVLHRGSGFA